MIVILKVMEVVLKLDGCTGQQVLQDNFIKFHESVLATERRSERERSHGNLI